MGLFDRIRKRSAAKSENDAPKSSDKNDDVLVRPISAGGNSSLVLVAPRVSEKAASLASKGTYVFNVPLRANKVEIRKAVESLYKVNVTSVRTVRGMGKRQSRGRIAGQRSDWKKALVTLKPGQKIELHEGV